MSTAMFVAHVEMQKKALAEYREAKKRYEMDPTEENSHALDIKRKKCILLSVREVSRGEE